MPFMTGSPFSEFHFNHLIDFCIRPTMDPHSQRNVFCVAIHSSSSSFLRCSLVHRVIRAKVSVPRTKIAASITWDVLKPALFNSFSVSLDTSPTVMEY
ncbi:MAG: hypothetical protein [Circular genetic element sp.]|nr:MAG: hypothetical protein [Circular genetic element sp.]